MFALSFSVKKIYLFALSQIILFSYTACLADEIEVEWVLRPNYDPFPSQTVAIGDTVVFKWPMNGGVHNVFLHPSGTCDEAGRLALEAKSAHRLLAGDDHDHGEHDHSGVNHEHVYTFTEVGEFVFACDIVSHCEIGNQIITFVVMDAADAADAFDTIVAPMAESSDDAVEIVDTIPEDVPIASAKDGSSDNVVDVVDTTSEDIVIASANESLSKDEESANDATPIKKAIGLPPVDDVYSSDDVPKAVVLLQGITDAFEGIINKNDVDVTSAPTPAPTVKEESAIDKMFNRLSDTIDQFSP